MNEVAVISDKQTEKFQFDIWTFPVKVALFTVAHMMYNQFTQGAVLYDHDVHHVAQMNAQNVPPDLESQRLTSHPRQTVVESMTAMPIENNNDREDKTKWTTVVIIILQLAAWSAVGTFLLEKGITTYLHDKNSTAHNVSSSTKVYIYI